MIKKKRELQDDYLFKGKKKRIKRCLQLQLIDFVLSSSKKSSASAPTSME